VIELLLSDFTAETALVGKGFRKASADRLLLGCETLVAMGILSSENVLNLK
jgi:hypothetical protein